MKTLQLFFILLVFALVPIAESLPAPVPTINPSDYNNVKNNISAYNMAGTIGAVWDGYVGKIGYLINLFMLLIIFSMYWIRQGHMGLATVIGLIFAGVFIALLPGPYQLYAMALIGVGGFAFILKLFSERK